MLSEDEIWYQQGDQAEFEAGYSVWKGRDCPDKIAVTATEGTAQAICNYTKLLSAAVAALQYLDNARQLPDHATTAERFLLANTKGMLRGAIEGLTDAS